MVILVLFAAIAGAGTAVSPCVLPVLPALLSAGAVGGRRRPIGIVLGLSATFTITIVGVAKVVDGVGLGDNFLRYAAITALLLFGIAVAVPQVAARLEAPLSRLGRLGPRTAGDGFGSGIGVGAALGFVYAPCAGPILAAVISVSAASGRTVAVALGYAAGSALVLLALALGGRRISERIRRAGRGVVLQRALGAVMIVTAVGMFARLDIKFQTQLAHHLSGGGVLGFLANPTGDLEKSHAVKSRLADLRGKAKFDSSVARASTPAPSSGLPGVKTPPLPRLGQAPDFTETQRWFNTPGGRPLTMQGLRGRVVLIDFWTYTCINCIRTQPYLKAWDARYRSRGLTIVGVHSPEFSFEKDAGNVQRAIESFGIRYPVVQDNDLATWSAWGNQYWPAEYLIDAQGKVRHVHFGEGDYGASEAAIRSLLAERDGRLGGRAKPHDPFTISAATTPETYVGSARAERWLPSTPRDGTHTYAAPASLPTSHFALGGTWRVTPEDATAVQAATLTAHVHARHVYLVLGGRGTVGVDVAGGHSRTIHVTGQRLYTLADFPHVGEHVLRLSFTPGVSAFAFTFG
jgi:cytochrome c biogenesis protein CcdA/thiol-disulfide isomerase/thioredoxin